MPLLNDFRIGADPEFALVEDGHLREYRGTVDPYSPWGLDHGRYVIEPHPKPALSVKDLINNIRVCLNDFATVAAAAPVWKALPYIAGPERRLTLGGHVHVDRPECTSSQVGALDTFARHLENLDILPKTLGVERRANGYGAYSDIRREHGHFEYRTFPSWLFSQRVAKLCLLGSKLIVVDPESVSETMGTPATASVPKLKSFFERFQNKDSDVDWILGSRMLDKKLVVRPDRDLRDVWRVKPEKETPRWKQEQGVVPPITTAGPTRGAWTYPFYITKGGRIIRVDAGYSAVLTQMQSDTVNATPIGQDLITEGMRYTPIMDSRRTTWPTDQETRVVNVRRDGVSNWFSMPAGQRDSITDIQQYIRNFGMPLLSRFVTYHGLLFQLVEVD